MLEEITPVVLTYNEAPNIGRTLDRLRWAREVVVVDSLSTDETPAIASQFSNARIFQRQFDNFAGQWQFAINETGINSEWVLTLDADFIVTPETVQELASLRPEAGTHIYKANLTYCIQGRALRSGLLPALPVLYRRREAVLTADGHAYRVSCPGETRTLRARLLHDDRKPLKTWIEAQSKYAALECAKLLSTRRWDLSLPDRIRLLRVFAPVAILIYCLVFRGGLFDGWPGMFYAFQRMFAEILLSLYLIEHDLSWKPKPVVRKLTAAETERADGSLAMEDRPIESH